MLVVSLMAAWCVKKKTAPPGFFRGAAQHLRAVELIQATQLEKVGLMLGLLGFKSLALVIVRRGFTCEG